MYSCGLIATVDLKRFSTTVYSFSFGQYLKENSGKKSLQLNQPGDLLATVEFEKISTRCYRVVVIEDGFELGFIVARLQNDPEVDNSKKLVFLHNQKIGLIPIISANCS